MVEPDVLRWILAASLIAPPGVAAAQTCELAGRLTLEHVRVEPDGGEPLDLRLREYPAALRREGDRFVVTSRGPLAFEGTASTADAPVALRRLVVVSGALELRPGVRLSDVRLVGHGASVRAELSEGAWLETTLPCDAIALGDDEEEADIERRPDAPSRGGWMAHVGSVRVYGVIGGPSILLRIATGAVRFAEMERRDGWVRVRRDFGSWAVVAGWVRASDLREVPEAPMDPAVESFGFDGLTMCGTSRHGSYYGQAILLRGGHVYDAADGHPWAVAREDLEVRVVVWGADHEWARIDRLPGLESGDHCPLLEHAWVRRSAIRISGPE